MSESSTRTEKEAVEMQFQIILHMWEGETTVSALSLHVLSYTDFRILGECKFPN